LRVSEQNTTIGDPITKTIPLGMNITETVMGTISLDEIYQLKISGMESVTFIVNGTVKIALLGFVVPGIEFPIPDQIFTLP